MPELRANTRTLYVAKREEAESAKYFENVRRVLESNPCLQIISIDNLIRLRNDETLLVPESIYAGMILVSNPYLNRNAFINAENASFEIRRWKLHKILEIAGLLGAKSCSYSERKGIEYKRKINDDFTVRKSNWFTTNLKLDSDENFKKIMGVEVNGEFPGVDQVSELSYNDAILLAESTGLNTDPEIDLLLSTRNPRRENRQTNYSYHFNMTQEANSYLDAAFALSIAGVFDISANLKSTLETKQDIDFCIQFMFPNNNRVYNG